MADLHILEGRRAPWRDKWYEVIFGHETRPGQLYDIVLIVLICLSVLSVLLESVRPIREAYGFYFQVVEWTFTCLFTIEYVARLMAAKDARRYATSFYGIVDLVAIAPIYLSVFYSLTHSFAVVRSLRLVRVFRILKLTEYTGEAAVLQVALRQSARKIVVFLFVVLSIVTIVGALMYQVEGEANGFTSIPTAMYWAIVTVTTVGYGDISPHTLVGRVLASMLMIIGYAIIAVPTGIVSFEYARASAVGPARLCPACGLKRHDQDAIFCKRCGTGL
jgi:voltage-gated potassium channel